MSSLHTLNTLPTSKSVTPRCRRGLCTRTTSPEGVPGPPTLLRILTCSLVLTHTSRDPRHNTVLPTSHSTALANSPSPCVIVVTCTQIEVLQVLPPDRRTSALCISATAQCSTAPTARPPMSANTTTLRGKLLRLPTPAAQHLRESSCRCLPPWAGAAPSPGNCAATSRCWEGSGLAATDTATPTAFAAGAAQTISMLEQLKYM